MTINTYHVLALVALSTLLTSAAGQAKSLFDRGCCLLLSIFLWVAALVAAVGGLT